MFWFIVLLLVVGAGFYFYQKMMTIEREVRAEQEMEKVQTPAAQEPKKQQEKIPKATVFDAGNSLAAVVPETSDPTTLKGAVLAEVTKQAGMKQTELYPLFAETSKKQLQHLLKEMADDGILRREKQGSSYLLYPA
ncbi:MAG: hypothetical protein PF441_06270 [Desulfuromusa sp.]|jgi:Flp pilus assembly protein TadB|nr:hypothetical protein [Desulfuromusa sp.]